MNMKKRTTKSVPRQRIAPILFKGDGIQGNSKEIFQKNPLQI